MGIQKSTGLGRDPSAASPSAPSPNDRRDSIDAARIAMRLGFHDEAEAMIGKDRVTSDATALNLLGVIREARGDWRGARSFYSRAARANLCFTPARENLRRLYEMWALGRADDPPVLGDERPALARLLCERDGDEDPHGPSPALPDAYNTLR